MSITTLLPLLSSILVFILGVLVLQKGKKEKVNFVFGVFSLAIIIWMFGTFMMFLSENNIDKIVFWDKFVYTGVVYIPVVMFHFGLVLINKSSKTSKLLLIVGYFLSSFFLLLIPTKLFITDVFIYQWGAHTKAQFFHHIFLIYFFIYINFWFVYVYRYYKSLIFAVEREKIKYCFLAFLILSSVGSLGYLPAYGIGIYPFAYLSGVIFTIILAYAIIVHRFMDIKIVLRKSSVYLISLLTVLILVVAVKYIFIKFFPDFAIWLDVIILILALSVFPPIKNYYYRLANKYFFASLYDSGEVIAKLSDKLRSTLELNKICEFISSALMNAFHTEALGILIYNEKTGNYIIQRNTGFNISRVKKIIKGKQLYKLCAQQNESIVVEELKRTSYKQYKQIIDLLINLKIETVTPLNIKDKTIGIIIAGIKESGDMYNDEDLKVLKVISAQAAIAIENALLYEETKNFAIKLKKEVEKATAELRAANKKLKKLDAAKSEFISIASHQLRTPLTIIKGYISMMIEGAFGQLSEQELSALEKVYDSNERLIQLVENLLNISRIESGSLQFNFTTMQLEDIVDSVTEEMASSAKKKGLRLDYKKPGKLLPKVKIDEEKIRQVVLNLIDNAIKYTKQGGITVKLEQTGSNIQFCVSDTGVGISQEDLSNLFKKFSRGKGISTVHTEGTGLGLYVSKMMIKAHQGKIWCESEGEGRGSRFCFKLGAG